MVSQDSATYAVPTEDPLEQIAIGTNHSDMVRFADNFDRHYIIVRNKLSEAVGKAPRILQQRCGQEKKKVECTYAWRNPGKYSDADVKLCLVYRVGSAVPDAVQ